MYMYYVCLCICHVCLLYVHVLCMFVCVYMYYVSGAYGNIAHFQYLAKSLYKEIIAYIRRGISSNALTLCLVFQASGGTYVIAAQFAAQVAATLTLPMVNKDPRAQGSYQGSSEFERGVRVEESAEPLEITIQQPLGNVLSPPEAEKLSSVNKLRGRKKSKDVQKSTNGAKSSNLEMTKGVVRSPCHEKLPDGKMYDGVVGDSLESELHMVAPPISNASSGAESCDGCSAMSGDGLGTMSGDGLGVVSGAGFGTVSGTSFNATLGQDGTGSVFTSGDTRRDAVCGATADAHDSKAFSSHGNGTKTYPSEVNADPTNLDIAAQDVMDTLTLKSITVRLQSASLELRHQHEDSISPGRPTSFPDPHESPCSSPILIPDIPVLFPGHGEPQLSSPNKHLISELPPLHTSLPGPNEPGTPSLVTQDTGEERPAAEDVHEQNEEQTDQLVSSDPMALAPLETATHVQTKTMEEASVSDEGLQSEMSPSTTFDDHVLDLEAQGDKAAMSNLFESPTEHGNGFDYSHACFLVEPNSQAFPPAACQLPDPARSSSTSESLPDLGIQNCKSVDDLGNMASPVVKETADASETDGLDSDVSLVSTDRREMEFYPSRLLSGGNDRCSDETASAPERGHHPLNGKQAGWCPIYCLLPWILHPIIPW